MTNLTGNAIKFTEKGHVVVSVGGEVSEDNVATMKFSVRDTGIGIPEHKQEAVFREFEQVDGASNRKYEGTGLGLAISRKLIRLMGSEISLKSVEHEGSEFFFNVEFPVDMAVVAEPEYSVNVSFAGRKILVVDDLPINREILSRQVESWGMTAVLASGGDEAIRKALEEQRSDNPIEIAIFDYQMPGMDGHALCRQFKDNEHLADIPVLLLSSVDQSTQKDRVRELGFADCMIKPTRAEVLRMSVNRTLSSELGLNGSATDDHQPSKRKQLEDEKRSGIQKILIVEDNEINQLVITSMLDSDVFELEIAENGELGVEAYKNFKPHLVFMDVSMPVMNGFDATGLIREFENNEGKSRCPVIALTANAMQGDREKCIESGMDDFMSKPIIMKDLFCAIEKWLDGTEMPFQDAA